MRTTCRPALPYPPSTRIRGISFSSIEETDHRVAEFDDSAPFGCVPAAACDYLDAHERVEPVRPVEAETFGR
jgi:hypothetical protein